jgi:hypothetical protein
MAECEHEFHPSDMRRPMWPDAPTTPDDGKPPRLEPIRYERQCLLCGEWIETTK